jgi:outer membrane biosynthesis protein TonB
LPLLFPTVQFLLLEGLERPPPRRVEGFGKLLACITAIRMKKHSILKGERKMKNRLLQITAALSLAVCPLAAGPWDKLTRLDIKETILIPGKQLPPGKYVMKLAESQANRHIVMFYNEDQSKLEAIVLAIPNSRLQPTGDTALQYWETPAGVPPALRAWFYPGDNFGQEFAYPKNMAAELSRVNNAKVMHYDGPDRADYTEETFKNTEVHDAPAADTTVAAQTTPTPGPAPSPESASVATNPEPAPAPAPQPVADPEPAPQPVTVAQNRPVEQAPAPEPVRDPIADDQLPQTASNIPAVALMGLTLVGVAAALRRRPVRS